MRAPLCRAPIGRGRLSAALACALATAASPALAKAPAAADKSEAGKSSASQPAAQGAAATGGKPAPAGAKPAAAPAQIQKFDIDEYEIQGADALPQIEVEEAVYPFLGPDRTPDDVEKARAALEKAYQAKGLQTVSVSVPPQNVERRVIVLKVAEAKVGRLRVKGSRYFDQEKIAGRAPSLKEGELPDFNNVTKDVTALNQWPDRRVTPALRAGVKPGTVDVDLNVEDTLPLHASVEINNRKTPNTHDLRVSSTVRYENLWQLGHSLTLNYTIAPERPKDAQSFSASYLFRVPDNEQLSFLFSALKSKSDTPLGFGFSSEQSANVVGPTAQLGARAVFTLPARGNLFHTFSVGGDYKESKQTLTFAIPGDGQDDGPDITINKTPLHYYTLAAAYNATYQGEAGLTQLNSDLTLGLRGLGSNQIEFETKRTFSRGDFLVLKGDLSHTHELPKGFQAYGKVQGQLASQALVSSEQFGVGGLDTVRGYLESQVVGDNGIATTIELRSPDLANLLFTAPPEKEGAAEAKLKALNELRFFGFVDAGYTKLREALPEQRNRFGDWSAGVGANFKSFDYLNGSIVMAIPMVDEDQGTDNYTKRGDPRLLFRFWGEF